VSYLQFNKEGTGRGFKGCMIQLFRYRDVLSRLHSNNRWRSAVAFNHIRCYDDLQIQLIPVFRSLLQHCVQTSVLGSIEGNLINRNRISANQPVPFAYMVAPAATSGHPANSKSGSETL